MSVEAALQLELEGFRFIPDFLWQEFGAIRRVSLPRCGVQQVSPLTQIGGFELLLTG